MERLQQLLRAIDTYEVGYVIERDLMQYVFAEDLEAEDYDDVIILNVLLLSLIHI